jgi:hypothetical protein
MAFGFKNLFAALAALVFSAGHVACACLPSSSGIPDSQIAEAAAHSHEAAGAFRHHDHGSAPSENSGGPFDDRCDHCQIAQFAGAADAAKLQAPTLAAAPFIAILSSVTSTQAPTLFLEAAARLHWAAPPGLSPVSLKIRLLI